ncbi:MAG: hypothetical protein ACR2OX_08980, partial [Methyloligellaceae bacterium]
AWTVGFVVFVQAQMGQNAHPGSGVDPTVLAAVINIAGLPAILFANEVARRVDRRTTIIIVMMASSCVGLALAGAAAGPFVAVLTLLVIYGVLVPADSGSINAGLLEVADPASRGSILGLHAVIGFAGAFLGPVLFGLALDMAGGPTDHGAWIAAFACFVALASAGSYVLWRWS